MRTIQEINSDLEKLYKERSRLYEQEEKLQEEKNELLNKEIIDDKLLNRYKWRVEQNNDKKGFILRPIFDNHLKFDDIQEKLNLYPHGDFNLNENITIIGDDGDLYILSYDIVSGIEFIKRYKIEVEVDRTIVANIHSMEMKVAKLKEFVDQFDKVKLFGY
jgi:hypothetical protein